MRRRSEPTRRRARGALGILVLLAATLVLAAPPAAGDANEAPAGLLEARSLSSAGPSCAVLDDGTVRCWGSNSSGALGLGDTESRGDEVAEMGDLLPPVDLGSGHTATEVSTGSSHACAILEDGTVKCWGNNFSGVLGIGSGTDRGDQASEMGDALPIVDLGTGHTATAISAGRSHTCVILENGTVKCWGEGDFGRLGYGDAVQRGDQAGEMGDALPIVNLGTGRTAAAISAGDTHTCALLDNGTVKCWGEGDFGRLGQGNSNDLGDGAGEMGDLLAPVALGAGRTALSISVGQGAATCALLDNHTVKCWGDNTAGRLGYGNSADRGDQAGEMGDSLPAVDLGTGRTAIGLSGGGNFSCALLDDHSVKCWGNNGNGQSGIGNNVSHGDAAGEMGDNLPAVDLGTGHSALAISAGQLHTCALLEDHSVKCWGFNTNGQLGLGDQVQRGDGPTEMGNLLPIVELGSGHTVTPVARLRATVTADAPSVVVGQDIQYQVTITNTGGLPVNQVSVSAPDVPSCENAVGNLPVGGFAIYACTHTTVADDVPVMVNQVLASSPHGTFALSGARRTRVDPRRIRPDAQIRVGAGAFIGTTTYNATGAGQARSANVGNRGTATFTVRVQNDGNAVEDLRVKGLGATSRFTVTYKDGAANITAAVVAGTFTVSDLGPGATHDLTLTIRAKAGTPVGTTLNRTTTIASTDAPAVKDTVKATVRRR